MKNNERVLSFKLGGRTIRVEYPAAIEPIGLGRADNIQGLITVAQTCKGRKVSRDGMASTFFHEMTHIMLDELGYREESANEKLVQGLSVLLHQFVTTVQTEEIMEVPNPTFINPPAGTGAIAN